MAAKKKSSPKEQWDQAVKSGAIRPLKNPSIAESLGSAGSTPSTKGTKTTSLPKPKTPVRSGGGDFSVAGFQTPGIRTQATPGQIIKAAGTVAGAGALSATKIVTKQVVSEGTKKLQRELSQEMKKQSDKDIRSLPKAKREEVAYSRYEDRVQSEADFYQGKMNLEKLRKDISKSMKDTTKIKKGLQIKRK